ncbi:MAG: PblA, partial [Ruminococcus sp.]|nr:PblA [Ruminococcus sp.]
AIGALSKLAIESYADYEQLVGGVETLFKDSAGVVEKYADEAFRTAGMSANQYMETVTGFSASLLQGLGNDTAKAAEIANQAVIDMSDNANKMGTDMQSIQNAYQGFAKQNYTMLDNLKLGYGGTQAEMARLINDSGVLGDTVTVTADNVNSVSFDKIIEAIHVVQTEMGISGISAEEAAEAVKNGLMTEEEAFEAMGTTAKEAATTIQGSISSLKAAWENALTGMADPAQDFDRLLENLVDSVLTVADNLAPRIMAVLPQMAKGVTELANKLLPLIPETLADILPAVLDGANALIFALLDTLSQIADTAIPIISENAGEIISTLVTSLAGNAPMLAGAAVDLINTLAKALTQNIGLMTQGALDIVFALADGISECLPELIPAAVEAVVIIAETLLDNVDKLLDSAEKIITGLADGLRASLPLLLEKVPEIVIRLAEELIKAIPDIIVFAVEFCEKTADSFVNFDWSAMPITRIITSVRSPTESGSEKGTTMH